MKLFTKMAAFFLAGSMILMSCQNTIAPSEFFTMPLRKSQIKSSAPPLSSTDQFDCQVSRDTPYYQDGPQQARPADGILKARTKLRIIKEAGSYVLVESANKIRGYVATDDIEGFALNRCKINHK